jgi:hypothetical protein
MTRNFGIDFTAHHNHLSAFICFGWRGWGVNFHSKPNDYEDYRQQGSLRNGDRKHLESWVEGPLLATSFDGLGVLVTCGVIARDFVEDLFSRGLLEFWDALEPCIPAARQRHNDPVMYDGVACLYDAMKKRGQQATVSTYRLFSLIFLLRCIAIYTVLVHKYRVSLPRAPRW